MVFFGAEGAENNFREGGVQMQIFREGGEGCKWKINKEMMVAKHWSDPHVSKYHQPSNFGPIRPPSAFLSCF